MSKKSSPNPPRILQVRKDRDYDCVYLHGRKIILGRSGTPEAEVAFRQLQIQVLSDPTFMAPKPQQVTVDTLCFAYLQHAKEHDPGHFSTVKTAVEILLRFAAGQSVESLDSRSFLLLQEMFVQHGVSRQYCNALMKFIRAMLKWGTIRKLVSHQVYWEAKFVPALKKGKTSAYEKPPRQDVPDEVIDRTLPHLLPTIRDMVQVQRLASMRPSEVFRMKPGEIDTEFTTPDGIVIWMYTPGTNKNSWREKHKAGEYVRIIPLGKPEQDILAPRMVGKSDTDHLFNPKDTVQEHFAIRAAKRKTKVQPKNRTVYAVSSSDTAVPVADLMKKGVSIYPNCMTSEPSDTATIRIVLETFKTGGHSKERIEIVRSEPDKDKRNELKKRLALVFLYGILT